jgi:hypothetical protein
MMATQPMLANATSAGSWYTFDDRTVANSEPPVVMVLEGGVAPPGTISPAEGAEYDPSSDQVTLTDPNTNATISAYYREFQASGEANPFNAWGAGFGLDFSDVPPDGGNWVPFNLCDGGGTTSPLPDGSLTVFDDTGASISVGIPQPYDASAWTGVQFYLKWFGSGKPIVTLITIDDDQTSPWANNGNCNACLSTVQTSKPYECANSWQTKVLPTTSWTLVQVPFSVLKTDTSWFNQKLTGIDKNAIYNLHWKYPGSLSTPVGDVDVAVAMVSFYK